ncbi:MAG TPA: glycosyltransferase family 39 protein [Pyrinomonadaceae bacterium]|jgi:4-amino-4-deoxy-L-arabinose transferase-like glycosyltransferase|nr:glycosyltransferase family 39 protein [Pyrinomonadaceae bacterium]
MESPTRATRNSGEGFSQGRSKYGRRKAVAFALVFLAAFGVRLLCWQDARSEAAGVQTAVTDNYKHLARLLRQNGASSFFDPSSTTSDPDLLGHPPGYPIVLAFLYKGFGEQDAAAQIFQIVCDSLAAALVLLIASELLPFGVGVIAGTLVALAPQFCWNCVLLLPDTLAVLPVLLAVLLILRARARHAFIKALAAGVLVGVSCWLRANALLLAPFLLLLVPLLFARGRKLRPALALVGGALVAVAPLTVRNAVVFGHFIPVSLGAGQTFVEGLADYDPGRRFGLPDTDIELMRQEALIYGKSEYSGALFTPDGFERDRARTSRGLAVISSHPLWFASVMARRAASMLRLERTPLTSTLPVSEGWTRVPRFALRVVQKMFITAIVLPLVLFGAGLLARERNWRALAALLAVPLYYLCVQSALHTEYRYVLGVQYFLLVLAAASLYHGGLFTRRKWSERGR